MTMMKSGFRKNRKSKGNPKDERGRRKTTRHGTFPPRRKESVKQWKFSFKPLF